MAIIVQKFGGTSIANLQRIKNVARIIRREVKNGNKVVAVVSAMSGVTDQLSNLLMELSPATDSNKSSQYDVVLSSGEQVTAGLLSLCLQSMHINAQSWLGWQLPIITDDNFGNAKIESINIDNIKSELDNGQVAVIAGFQGVNSQNMITTLGRGGSDTTAVAIASIIGAERCDIYTDVDGVYTADPRIVSRAHKLPIITYDEMLEMSSLGAKVLHIRAVELAMKYNVNVRVVSSFEDNIGTIMMSYNNAKEFLKGNNMEKLVVTGIAHNNNELLVKLKVTNESILAQILAIIAEQQIVLDMVNFTKHGDFCEVSFVVNKLDIEKVRNILFELKLNDFEVISDITKISIIGVGIRHHCFVMNRLFATLESKNIPIKSLTTSEIKISIIIADDYTELALRTLHTSFGLDKTQ
jgi:aspartate kinase